MFYYLRNILIITLIISIFISFTGCNDGNIQTQDSTDILPGDNEVMTDEEVLNEPFNSDSIKTIFYDLTTPVELTQFIKYSNTIFDPDILNSIDNRTRYNVTMKMALNLGVYGTDLIYCRMYNQKQWTVKYLASIRQISKEIGIPEEKISNTLGKAEQYMENKDSLLNIIQDAYLTADDYLKENDRNSIAALIYFGAWTEAVYIAVNLYQKNNSNKEHLSMYIAEQKFSLNNLHKLLKNSYDNDEIYHYILMVNRLKKVFDDIQIYVSDTTANIDTLKKVITVGKTEVKITPEQIIEIIKAIRRIRNDIIS
ncbi:MAG: hypothetical protein HY738_13290 [Bacteroidia bacterium]|nr:hypothetical protein [Bacteroidia bacterium]